MEWLKDVLSYPIKLNADKLLDGTNSFSINLILKGSEKLYVSLLGNTTKLYFESS